MSNKLLGVHPELQQKIAQVIAAMAALGFEMRVTDGLRTVEQQQALFALGRTKPGNVVTNADGVAHRSNHQTHSDGFGHAVDATFWVDGEPSWAEELPWRCYAECAKALGLKAGADWGKPDKPHVELP